MYRNIGGKIKGLARIICWIGIIGSIIVGIILGMLVHELLNSAVAVLIGLMWSIIGALFAWIGSFLLYGYGELVENSDIRTELAVKEVMERDRAH